MKRLAILFITLGFIIALIFYFNSIYIFVNKLKYPIQGLDISNHQGIIDWEIIENKYTFIIIKATEGDDFVDKSFARNIANAKEKNFVVGAYHFFHFKYSGIEQAENFINVVGKNISLPPIIDIEYGGNTNIYDVETVKLEITSMINMLREYYKVEPILYLTKESYDQLELKSIASPIWMRSVVFPIINEKRFLLWQFSNSGKVKGIKGKVDINAFIGDESRFKEIINRYEY